MDEAIVSTVVGKLSDLLIEEAEILNGVLGDEIEQVVTKLKWMQTFLRDADSKITEHKIRVLVAEIRDVAYEAEHVESFLVKTLTTEETKENMQSRTEKR